ncbi:hypothetical protein KKC44_06530, partial [Patescibacteria group bacterium]|nr:hypothetical protein [Patescibacteria group bacterium]
NPGDANNGVCDASEPDCIEVEADNYTYVVYNEDNLCYKEDKGCQRLGDPYQYGSQVIYGDIFLENNPDNYASLCNEDGIGCEKWKTNEGDSNFKDPGDMVCEWRQGYQDKIGWWKEKIKRCDDGGVGTEKGIIDFGIENNVCLTDADCGETPIGECTIDSNCSEFEKCVDSKCHYACIQDTNDYACDTDDLKTIGYGGVSNKIEQPKKDDIGNYWAGLCSADQAGCTEYIDPISKFNTNIIFNADFSQDSDGASPADGWSGGNQEVILEPNSLYILALEGNDLINLTATNPVFRELSNINNFSNPSTDVFIDSTGGRKSKIFYTTSGASAKLSAGTTSQNNGNKIELKKAIVDYQLRQELTVPENSNVNFKEGQILFNERKISGAGGYVKLNRDADTSPIVSGTWAECIDNPENCDSNSLYQVTPDRACNEWLACRSYIKDENDNNVCFDIGLCDRMDDNGACDSFVIEDKVNQTYDTYVQDISNLSGYSKVGYKNSQSNSFIPPNDQYLLGEMEQKGEVAKLPNGNFEVAGTNGYPIGWVYEGGSGITQSVFPPDYPGAATTTSLSWNTNVFKVINNPFETQEECLNPNCSTYVPEGRNFLRLGSTFNATSEFIEVEPNALYVITAHINTLNLAEGEVRVKIFNTDGGEIEVKPAIKLNLGNKWTFKLGKFNTNNSSQIKVRLMAEGSEEDPNGKFYFDDIKIRPALEIKDLTPPPSSDDTEFWHTPQSCRLYPEDDSLSCDYYDDSGLRQKGWLGYCLEY